VELLDVGEEAGVRLAAVEQGEDVAARSRRLDDLGTQERRAAQDEDLHRLRLRQLGKHGGQRETGSRGGSGFDEFPSVVVGHGVLPASARGRRAANNAAPTHPAQTMSIAAVTAIAGGEIERTASYAQIAAASPPRKTTVSMNAFALYFSSDDTTVKSTSRDGRSRPY
jgi:hypothetical protein